MSTGELVALVVALVVVLEAVGYALLRRSRRTDWARRVRCPTCGHEYNVIHRGECPRASYGHRIGS